VLVPHGVVSSSFDINNRGLLSELPARGLSQALAATKAAFVGLNATSVRADQLPLHRMECKSSSECTVHAEDASRVLNRGRAGADTHDEL